MNYKELLYQFLSNEKNRHYALPIFKKLIQAIKHGPVAEVKKAGREELIEKMPAIFEKMKNEALKRRRYVAHIFPTIISPELAPNFYIGRESPTEDEIYRFFYLIISGIYKGSYVINLDNVDEKLISKFREELINENLLVLPSQKGSGIDVKKLLNCIGVKVAPLLTEFIYSFAIISFFISWIKSLEKVEEWNKNIEELGLDLVLEKLGIRDDITLVIFNIPREKKEMYYIPRLKNFFLTWYKKFLENRENSPSIVMFIFSTYITDMQYRELSSSLLNKFLYYFLNGYVNGELLNKLINLKIHYELKRKPVYGFIKPKEFFAELPRNVTRTL
ncbi:hypothetical protein KEJ20_02370 [Candidatus Bathyarchaeota archaeon]|nr:hypothetical protein [Candidatus Bathyarchaeota archaeon]